MKRVLVYSQSNIRRDPRVLRQVAALKDECRLTVVGFGESPCDGIDFVSLADPSPEAGRYGFREKAARALKNGFVTYGALLWIANRIPFGRKRFYPRFAERINMAFGFVPKLRKAIAGRTFDLVIANDLSALVPAFNAANGAKVLYDAHEYSPGQVAGDPRWARREGRLVDYLLRKYLPRCAGVMTVCDGIADEYRDVFGIERPLVVWNAPEYRDREPSRADGNGIRLVHHGIAARKRSIETMIRAVGSLGPRCSLDLYLLYSDETYMRELREEADRWGNTRFMEPVPTDAIPEMLSRYDAGLAFFPPATFNLLHALPNKFFEFVQGRLAIVSGPSPEMAKLIEKHGLGVVAEGFGTEDLADAIKKLSADSIAAFKRAAASAARELSATTQMELLRKIVREIA